MGARSLVTSYQTSLLPVKYGVDVVWCVFRIVVKLHVSFLFFFNSFVTFSSIGSSWVFSSSCFMFSMRHKFVSLGFLYILCELFYLLSSSISWFYVSSRVSFNLYRISFVLSVLRIFVCSH